MGGGGSDMGSKKGTGKGIEGRRNANAMMDVPSNKPLQNNG